MEVTERLRAQLELRRGGSGRLASMEGLRGLAVLLVFLVHFSELSSDWLRTVEIPFPAECRLAGTSATSEIACRVGNMGNIGVDLFFVLSGFLIYGGLMRRPQAYRPYMARRLRRIYPTYLVVLAVYVVLALAMPSEGKLPSSPAAAAAAVLANVLLLPGIVPVAPIITVSWTLSFELFFYLTVPGLIAVAHLRERSSAWRTRLFVALALLCTFVVGGLSGAHPRLSMFFAGMLLWEWTTTRAESATATPEGRRRLDTLGLVALVVAVVAPMYLLSDLLAGFPRLVVLFVGWPVLCAACFYADGRAQRMFSVTPLRWLGNMSYSYYLVHSLVLQGCFELLRRVVPPTGQQPWVWWALLLPCFAATLVVSYLLFVGVERRWSLSTRGTPAPG
ncbi:MAG: acyltransferase family protein [Actinomycetes bacterium]